MAEEFPLRKAVRNSSDCAIDWASDVAFNPAYSKSKADIAAVSARTSSTGWENHLAIERFISPEENQNIASTGKNDRSRFTTTRRVRNLDPAIPSRRSA